MKWTIIVLMAASSIAVHAASLDFAEFLFEENDYYRTVTELKRAYYEGLCTDTAELKNTLGVCYMKMEDYSTAMLYFDEIRKDHFRAGDNYFIALFMQGDMERILDEEAKTEKQENIKTLAGIFSDRVDRGFASGNEEIDSIAGGYFKIQRKNALIAVLLSGILPGAGRIYAGRLGDGLFSMSTVILPAIAVYFYYSIGNDYFMYGAGGLAGLFYLGELYGAYNSAKQYFPAHKRAYYEKIIESDYSILSPDYSF